jgi:enoyl-CoA hydratase/carnithine racemase
MKAIRIVARVVVGLMGVATGDPAWAGGNVRAVSTSSGHELASATTRSLSAAEVQMLDLARKLAAGVSTTQTDATGLARNIAELAVALVVGSASPPIPDNWKQTLKELRAWLQEHGRSEATTPIYVLGRDPHHAEMVKFLISEGILQARALKVSNKDYKKNSRELQEAIIGEAIAARNPIAFSDDSALEDNLINKETGKPTVFSQELEYMRGFRYKTTPTIGLPE